MGLDGGPDPVDALRSGQVGLDGEDLDTVDAVPRSAMRPLAPTPRGRTALGELSGELETDAGGGTGDEGERHGTAPSSEV